MQNGGNESNGVNSAEGGDTTASAITKSKSSPKKKKSKKSGESSASRLERIRQKSEIYFIPSPSEEYAREEPLVPDSNAIIASSPARLRRRHASSGNIREKSKRAERTSGTSKGVGPTRRASCMTLSSHGSSKPTNKASSSGSKKKEKTSTGESSAEKSGRRKSNSNLLTPQETTTGIPGVENSEKYKGEGAVSMRKERTSGSSNVEVKRRVREGTISLRNERTVGFLDSENNNKEKKIDGTVGILGTDTMKKKGKSGGTASMRKERTVGTLDTETNYKERKKDAAVSMRKERTVGILDTEKKSDGTVSMRKERTVGIPGLKVKQRKRDGAESSRKERTISLSTRKDRTINICDAPPSVLTLQDKGDLPPSLMAMNDNSEKSAIYKKTKVVKKKGKSLEGRKEKKSTLPSGTSISPPASPSTRTRSTVKSSKAAAKPTPPLPSSPEREDTMSSTSTMETAAETAVSDFEYLSVTGPNNLLANGADFLDDTCHGDGDDLIDFSAYNQQGTPEKKRKEGLMVWFGDRPRVTEYIVKDKREITSKWYRQCDLDQLMEHEMRINMLQAGGKKMAQYCCQRGLEAQLLEKQMAQRSGNSSCPFQTKKERQAAHVRWVLTLQEALKHYVPAPKGSTFMPGSDVGSEPETEAEPPGEDNRVEILRRKCRSKTKDDRKVAYRYALHDARESQQIHKQDAEYNRVEALLAATEVSNNAIPLFGSMTSSMRNSTNSQRNSDADPKASMTDSMRSFRSSFSFRPSSNEKPEAPKLSKSSMLRSSVPASASAANIANPMASGGNDQRTNVSMLSRLSIRIKPTNSS